MRTNSIIVAVITLSMILITCSSYLGWRMGRSSQARYDAVLAHHTAVNNCLELGDEVCSRVIMATKDNMSIADFESEFGPVTSLDPGQIFPDSAKDATHVYVHQASYRTFYLRFKAGALVGHGSNHGVDDVQPHLPSIEERIAQM